MNKYYRKRINLEKSINLYVDGLDKYNLPYHNIVDICIEFFKKGAIKNEK